MDPAKGGESLGAGRCGAAAVARLASLSWYSVLHFSWVMGCDTFTDLDEADGQETAAGTREAAAAGVMGSDGTAAAASLSWYSVLHFSWVMACVTFTDSGEAGEQDAAAAAGARSASLSWYSVLHFSWVMACVTFTDSGEAGEQDAAAGAREAAAAGTE